MATVDSSEANPSSQGHGIVKSSKIPFYTAHKYTLKSRGRDYAIVIIMSHAPNIQDPPLLHFGDELNGFIILPKDNLSGVRSMEVAVSQFPDCRAPN